MLAAFALVLVASPGNSSSGSHMGLHELTVRADLCVAGVITRVDDATVEVEIEELGFGEPASATITVRSFRDPRSARTRNRSDDAVGQRNLYFLDAPISKSWHTILGAHGEG